MKGHKMTKLDIYTIMDRVSGANQLMTSPENTEKAMIRAFTDIVLKNETISRHAEDYVLVKLGQMDQQTGEIEGAYNEIFEASDIVRNTKEQTKNERQD